MAKSFFHFISKEDIFRKIKNLDNSKAVQKSDISVKTTLWKDDFFAQLMNNYFNWHK